MILRLPSEQSASEPRWFTIQVPDGTFEVAIRPPTFDEQLADAERFGGVLENRLRNHVVGWRGLEHRVVDTTDPENPVEKSEPLPYSFETLKRVCSAYRGVMPQLASAVGRVFRGLDGEERKN